MTRYRCYSVIFNMFKMFQNGGPGEMRITPVKAGFEMTWCGA
jgi:hypothetical protein